MKNLNNILLSIAIALLLAACSTTARIPSDELLYTGVKKVEMTEDSIKIPPALTSAVKDAVDVAPNNYWKLLGWHYPFPLGLWVYNNWPNPKSGLRHWLYEKLVEEPVLVSDVRPEVRTHMIEQLLDDNGYFRGTATYELVKGRNPKKAKILYTVNPGPAFPIDTVMLLPDSTRLNSLVDSLVKADPYLPMKSPRFSIVSLSNARKRITNSLRNRG